MSGETLSTIVLIESWHLKLWWQHQIRDQTHLLGVYHPIYIRPFHGLQTFFNELKLPLSLIILELFRWFLSDFLLVLWIIKIRNCYWVSCIFPWILSHFVHSCRGRRIAIQEPFGLLHWWCLCHVDIQNIWGREPRRVYRLLPSLVRLGCLILRAWAWCLPFIFYQGSSQLHHFWHLCSRFLTFFL